MTVRTARRIEVRLDDAHAERLERVLAAKGQNVSEFVREAIDQAADAAERRTVSALLASFRAAPLAVPNDEELREELEHSACPGESLCGPADSD